MATIAYFRVSSRGQSTQSRAGTQWGDAEPSFDEEIRDVGVSANDRVGFRALLNRLRQGDTLHVSALEHLGRDAADVQATVRSLLDKGVVVDVQGLGRIASGTGDLIFAVLTQVADMERRRLWERMEAGRGLAKATLASTGLTHRGKVSLGRRKSNDPVVVRQWRSANRASIAMTAQHFGLSVATVKRYCSSEREA